MADLWENPMQTERFEFVELDQIRRGALKPAA